VNQKSDLNSNTMIVRESEPETDYCERPFDHIDFVSYQICVWCLLAESNHSGELFDGRGYLTNEG